MVEGLSQAWNCVSRSKLEVPNHLPSHPSHQGPWSETSLFFAGPLALFGQSKPGAHTLFQMMQLCVYVSNHEIYKTALIWLHIHGKKGNLPDLRHLKPTSIYTPSTVILIIFTGSSGQSRGSVGTWEIFSKRSYPSTTLPKTGCADGVERSNQFRKLLLFTLMKNWEPPELGAPVLAMDKVPGSLPNLAVNSSSMLPPPSRKAWQFSNLDPD